MSKVAKKRIAAVVLIVVCALLVVTMLPGTKIVGNWKTVDTEYAMSMNFNSENKVVVSLDGAEVGTYDYKLNGLHFSIDYDEASVELPTSIKQGKLPAAVNKIELAPTKVKLEKTGFKISPVLSSFVILVLFFVILWCFEDDINVVINAIVKKFKKTKKISKAEKKAAKAAAKKNN